MLLADWLTVQTYLGFTSPSQNINSITIKIISNIAQPELHCYTGCSVCVNNDFNVVSRRKSQSQGLPDYFTVTVWLDWVIITDLLPEALLPAADTLTTYTVTLTLTLQTGTGTMTVTSTVGQARSVVNCWWSVDCTWEWVAASVWPNKPVACGLFGSGLPTVRFVN